MPDVPIAELLDHNGPFVSVYLDTTGNVVDAPERARLRWKNLRRELDDAGAPEAALAGIDPLVAEAHTEGDTLAVIAGPEGVLHHSHLPEPPARDLARFGSLPDLLPLLAWRQSQLPCVVVATDRVGADLLAVLPEALDRELQVQGEELHVTRSHPGGWSQRRFQQRAENRWEANAGAVAAALTRLADQVAPRLVVVAGDVRAVQFLRRQLPDRVGRLVEVVDGEYGSAEAVLARAADLVARLVEQDTAELITTFQAQFAVGRHAVERAPATLSAHFMGQVETLLLQPGRINGTAWFGPSPMHVADRPAALRAMGVSEPAEGHLADVLVRAAVGSGAAVRLLPDDEPGSPADGVGAILRYRDE
jgi:hypothetical protein